MNYITGELMHPFVYDGLYATLTEAWVYRYNRYAWAIVNGSGMQLWNNYLGDTGSGSSPGQYNSTQYMNEFRWMAMG